MGKTDRFFRPTGFLTPDLPPFNSPNGDNRGEETNGVDFDGRAAFSAAYERLVETFQTEFCGGDNGNDTE
jgi:hypothetical protein